MWLLVILWVWYWALADVGPRSSDPLDFLFRRTAETPIWVTGFGLMVAFTDTKAIARHAYWFIPYCVIMLAEFIPGLVLIPYAVVSAGLQPTAKQINEMSDIFACYSGLLFGSYIVARARTGWPGWRRFAMRAAVTVVCVVVLFFVTQAIGQAFPDDSVIRRFLSPN